MRTERTVPAGVMRYGLITLIAAAALCGCNMSGIPGLTTPELALSTPAPLPPPPPPTVPVRAGIPGAPVIPFERYTLDSGDQVRVVVFGQDNLSRVYSVDGSGYISMTLVGGIRARGLTTFQLASAIVRQSQGQIRQRPQGDG